MLFRKRTVTLALAALLALPLPASALMRGLSTEKLTRGALLIIAGRVEGASARWADDKTIIITTATVRVRRVIKGSLAADTVEVIYPGGEVGDIGMRQSDEPKLAAGENVILFLTPDTRYGGGGAYRIQGRAQGKYAVGPDGMARKKGFSALAADGDLDTAIPEDRLLEKIRSCIDDE